MYIYIFMYIYIYKNIWAAINDWLIYLIFKISENIYKCPLQIPEAEGIVCYFV